MRQLTPTRLFSSLTSGACATAWLLSAQPAAADNPIIQTVYTADPAPMVHEDTVYLCTSHDDDVTVDNFFTMNDWYVFSSKDMVNWTNHGTPLSWETFSWATANKSWAPHCIARDGKFYFYVPVGDKIGVAVSDSPTGPFVDAIGSPLLSDYRYIDPTVFIDDDGQAYLYLGNPKLWYVKLNDDMISLDGTIQEIPMTADAFGARRGGATGDRPSSYEEGPWFYKRMDQYYMVYPTGELPEHIAYSTSSGPTGPWSYGGEIMSSTTGHAFTNHPGVIDFKGHSYFFYHTQELPGGGGFKRSSAIEEFTYNADGSFPTIEKTREGVTESVEPLIPYYRVEGETMAWEEGIEVEDCSEGGRNVTDIDNGDYIKVESVDFLTGALSFEASVASNGSGGELELHLDGVDGTLIGSCTVSNTGGAQSWDTVSCDVSGAEGLHDLFLVFKGGGGSLFNLDWYQFEPKDPLPPMGTGGASGMGAGGSAMVGAGGGSSAGGATGMPGAGGSATGGATGAGAAGGGTGVPGTGGGMVGSMTGGDGYGAMNGSGDPGSGSGNSKGGCSISSGAGHTRSTFPLGLLLVGGAAAGWRLLTQRRERAAARLPRH